MAADASLHDAPEPSAVEGRRSSPRRRNPAQLVSTQKTAPRGATSTGANASAIEHHEPVAMPGANHASVSSKRFDDSIDYLILINPPVLDVGNAPGNTAPQR
jgi:hypothetical protein